MPTLEERVGDAVKRADGRGTDETDADGFVLVRGKKRRGATTVAWNDVGQVPPRTEGCGKSAKDNDVSRDHSLETILLAK